jgi:hydroxypyruvate isomerase
MPPKFSANLGFLFREVPLLDAVAAAAGAGFGAVECHWPYDTDPARLRAALEAHNVPLLALNTAPGDRERGDFGLAAMPGREDEARRGIDQAIAYAAAVGARHIHVMAGYAEGSEARAVFIDNLAYADARIGDRKIDLLIEPLNRRDAPGYFLRTLEQALDILDRAAIGRLKIMFDCYHLQIEGGDLLRRYQAHRQHIGHIQFAAVPDRGEPDQGEVAYERLLPALVDAGYGGWLGAEYRPRSDTFSGLAWQRRY